jgi:hypothetical protein
MTPADVESALKRLWSHEWELLNLVFDSQQATDNGGRVRRRRSSPFTAVLRRTPAPQPGCWTAAAAAS